MSYSREQSSFFAQGIIMRAVCIGLQSEQEKQLMRQVRKEGRKEGAGVVGRECMQKGLNFIVKFSIR